MNLGLIGGIAGCIIGIVGGVIGTACSIKNTKTPEERALMIKASVLFWIAALIFLVLLLILPPMYKWFLWIPYSIALPMGIIVLNKKQQQIRNGGKPEEEVQPSTENPE